MENSEKILNISSLDGYARENHQDTISLGYSLGTVGGSLLALYSVSELTKNIPIGNSNDLLSALYVVGSVAVLLSIAIGGINIGGRVADRLYKWNLVRKQKSYQ